MLDELLTEREQWRAATVATAAVCAAATKSVSADAARYRRLVPILARLAEDCVGRAYTDARAIAALANALPRLLAAMEES